MNGSEFIDGGNRGIAGFPDKASHGCLIWFEHSLQLDRILYFHLLGSRLYF